MVLFQDYFGGLPDPEIAADYWEAADEPSFPVMADPTAAVLDATPYEGNALPGKCILSPEMEMLDCRQGGNEDDWAFDIIEAHASTI